MTINILFSCIWFISWWNLWLKRTLSNQSIYCIVFRLKWNEIDQQVINLYTLASFFHSNSWHVLIQIGPTFFSFFSIFATFTREVFRFLNKTGLSLHIFVKFDFFYNLCTNLVLIFFFNTTKENVHVYYLKLLWEFSLVFLLECAALLATFNKWFYVLVLCQVS